MEADSESDEGIGKRRKWIIVLCISLLTLSIFWSVDSSFVYFLLAIIVFSLFRIFQLRRTSQPTHFQPSESQFEKPEDYRPSDAWVLWQQVKEIFRKNSTGPSTPQQGKIFVALVAGFIGFIFFITILAVIFGGDSGEEFNAYYQQATDYYNRQQYDSAAYYYKLAMNHDPENPELYFERGNAFLNGNKTDSALIMYDGALARNPQHHLAQYNKGYVYFSRKNYREAIDETKKIMAYNPGYNDAMLLIGDSFYNQSQLDSALRWYEGAYTNGYRSAILCHLMAYIYDVKGQTGQAINLYKEAIGQDSTIRDIYVRLGELVPGEEGERYRLKASRMQ